MNYEGAEAWVLGGYGALRGLQEVFVRDVIKDNPATVGWGALGAYIVAWDVLAPQTLTAGCHRALEKHPVLMTAAVGGVALHLLNKL